MGGSLAAACRKKFPAAKIIGVTRSQQALKDALKKRWIHEAAQDLVSCARQADFVVLCTPVDTFAKLLSSFDVAAKPGTIVTDVGSVKGEVVAWSAKKKFRNIQFVGAHPMVGSHQRGMGAARADLFGRGLTFITKSPNVSLKAYKTVKNFWKKLSGRVVETTAAAHDQIVAEISHLPHVVAACLVQAVSQSSIAFAAGGFLDTTRIAQGHSSIWVPIFRANQKAVLKALSMFENELRSFKSAVADGDYAKLSQLLAKAAKKRTEITL